MDCLNCRSQNPVDAAFCENCGSRLEVACPSCGGANRVGAKFCKKCGHALLEAAPASLLTGKFASVETYTPKHLAEKILSSKSSLEGERKQVTVLFADMKGSMELAAYRDPEEARKLFDGVIGHMMQAVHRFEGTVNHIMGDGIMALFGAPLAHEDHAVRACYAGVNMQDSVKHYASEIQRTEGIPIQIRIGLNSGEVVVGTIRNDLHMDYTAIGQTVHLASRMEQMAIPGSILLTPDTLQLAEGYVRVKSLGPVAVKGMSDPVEVFELMGATSARTRLQAAAGRGYTRFVGRDAETEQLRKALEQARLSHGQVVAVVGEPGVGKSRLFHEFIHSHQTEGWLIVESGSVSYGKASPYLPLIELLKSYFKIHDRDNQREIREKVTGKLLTLDESLKATLPAFLALLDVPIEDPEWQPLDPLQKRQRILDACKCLLFSESQAQPLLLVFEDLHWLDAETQTVLDSLVESLATTRLLLLVNYRPEYQHHWASKTFYAQIRLDSLPSDSAEELLQSLLGNNPSVEAIKQLLIVGTEGNPFFLEESVRTLIETKALQGEQGAYRLIKPVDSIQVPSTVQAVLAARIDRLSMEEKRILQSASVIGENIPFRILSSIAEMSEEELLRHLVHLQTAEFLYEAKLFPDLEYTFKHGLTCQVAYSSLVQDRRRALHAKVTEAIERFYTGRLVEHLERLAHHALRGEVWDKAVLYLRQAGLKAADRSAHREAVAYLDQALEAVNHLPETRQTVEQAIDIRLTMRSSLQPLGEQTKVFERMCEAQKLAESLDDRNRLGQVSAYLSGYFTQAGNDPIQAIENGQRALALSSAGNFSLQVQVNHFLGTAYHTVDDYDRAVNYFTRNIESLTGDQIYELFGLAFLPSVGCRYQLVSLLAERGEFTQAVTYGDEAIHIAERAKHPFSISTAYLGNGHLYLTQGAIDKAISTLEFSLETCRLWHFNQNIPRVAIILGYAYAVAGRTNEAIPLLILANERGRAAELRRFTQAIQGFALVGKSEEASFLASRALESSRRQGLLSREAWALYVQGQIASVTNQLRSEDAEASFRAAMAIGDKFKLRPLVAHCNAGLGKVYRRKGELQLAKEYLSDGIAMMRQMGMGLWLEKAEAELKEMG